MLPADIRTLLDLQPLNIYVAASTWYLYSPTDTNSIFKCSQATSTKNGKLNHAVLLAGYGVGYWLVKNSWGDAYGQQGYIKISNDPRYDCGIGFFVGYLA